MKKYFVFPLANFRLQIVVLVLAATPFVATPFFSSTVAAAVVTFEGTVDKVVPEKREIYVLSEGKRLELYFNSKTELMKAGQAAPFETLKKSLKVRVKADKVGKRLDPIKVELID